MVAPHVHSLPYLSVHEIIPSPLSTLFSSHPLKFLLETSYQPLLMHSQKYFLSLLYDMFVAKQSYKKN